METGTEGGTESRSLHVSPLLEEELHGVQLQQVVTYCHVAWIDMKRTRS